MLRRPPARLVRCCLLAACAVLLAGCDRLFGDEDYFPLPETMGGWRANLSAEFVRSRGLDPAGPWSTSAGSASRCGTAPGRATTTTTTPPRPRVD